jgi:hypothetical protein
MTEILEVYRFRVLIDSGDDIFRDIELREDQTFEDLHQAIIKAFGFFGDQMTSFYMSNDEWDKGLEIVLLDMGFEDHEATPVMATSVLKNFIELEDQKLIYVYDFLRMWIFYVERINTAPVEEGREYPHTVLSYGEAPKEESKEIPEVALDVMQGPTSEFDEGEDEIGDMFDSLEDYDEF